LGGRRISPGFEQSKSQVLCRAESTRKISFQEVPLVEKLRKQVSDGAGNTATKEFFWRVSDDMVLLTQSVADGARGKPYSYLLEADGGFLPYNWQIISGSLPDGLSLKSTTGVVSGTPTTRQSRTFTVRVSDSDSPAQYVDQLFYMEVTDELYIFTEKIPNGREDKPYIATVSARLGVPPYTWSLDSGVLPPGATLTSSPTVATLSRTPTQKGTYTFALKVRDSGTPTGEAIKEFTVNIYDEVVIETSALKYAFRALPYSESIVATGGASPYRWSLVQGNLPVGLTLNSTTGLISGISHVASGHSSEFKVRVPDTGNPSDFAERVFTIYVIDALEITTEEIQGALQKEIFEASLTAKGGISPYAWSISEGAFPEGLSLDLQTGMLLGSPSVCGSFDFTVKITDSAPVPHEAARAFHLDVICCLSCYEITGNVASMEGVRVNLSGDATTTTDTDAEGNYRFADLSNGNYTVTPVLAGHWMTPLAREVTVANLDVSSTEFEVRPNQPPSAPSTPSPLEGATSVSLEAILSWTGSDPDPEDTLRYTVRFGASLPPPEVAASQTGTNYNPGPLLPNTTYYWQTVATDFHGAQTEGPVWHFRTLNRPPNVPSDPVPVNDATDISLTTMLTWSGGDPDAGDTVLYDVYFGTAQDPPLVAESLAPTAYDPGELSPNTNYYWKIVSKDSNEGVTEGPVWSFRTLNR